MKDLTSLREAIDGALSEWENAIEAFENPQEGADVDALERSMNDAEKRHSAAVAAFQRAEKVAEARKNLPVEPVADEPEVRAATPSVSIVSEERTYEAHKPLSYFRDLFRAQEKGDRKAQERIERHAHEVRVDKRDVESTGTTGGADAFVPPLHLVDEYAEYVRGARVTANLIGSKPLPAGTDSITVPRVTTGVSVAAQTAQLQNFSETDLIATPITANVETIGGIQDISVQALEQSALSSGMDSLIYRELRADYDRILDTYVINGSGSSGQFTGLLALTGENAVTYTATTPTVAGLFPKIVDMIQQIHSGRLQTADAIVMHPRRWAWITTGLDSSNRPLVVPAVNNPQNAYGVGVQGAEGAVGNIAGVNVYLDANIPVTLSSTRDVIVGLRSSDPLLFEGTPTIESFRSIGSQNGYVRFRLYNYACFLANQWPESVGHIQGTGLDTPSF
jgi:HK97 family phage major capsid protein